MRRTVALGWAVLGVALAAGVASAHQLDASAFAAPIPLPALYAGAAATVAVTAGWLGWGPTVRVRHPGRTGFRLPPTWARPARLAARVGVLVLFVAALVHGLVGPDAPAENLATVVVWPLVLKGVAVAAVVAGSPWRLVSPWETLYDGLVAVEGDRIRLVGRYPERLGTWPAVVGFVLGVGILENLTVATRSPATTVAVAGGYATLMLLGGVAFGREWFARADALAVLFSLLGRVSMLDVERTADGGVRVEFRPPWTGCVDPVPVPGTWVFVVATVYTVSFDGFTATATFEDLRLAVADAVGLGAAGVALYLAGLCLFVASYRVATAAASGLATVDGAGVEASAVEASAVEASAIEPSAVRQTDVERSADGRPQDRSRADRPQDRSRADRPRHRSGAARAFAGSVVPIAAAYEVAHNYPFVAVNLGQAVGVLRGFVPGAAVDPVALLAWLPVTAFWVSQVVLVVGGHVVGVVAAHGVASERTETAADARRSHAPLVVVMVGYTVLSLWIISQPLAS